MSSAAVVIGALRVKILSIWTNESDQTMQTKLRGLLKVQSDLPLKFHHCLH